MSDISGSSKNHDALVRQYLESSFILIADQNSAARIGLKKLLVTMGATLHQIFLANSIEEAEEIIITKKLNIIFCDYQINGKFGLDLLQKQRLEHPHENKKSLFILVTNNTSQSAVAQAAEDDIDSYILKPYTVESFTISLTRAILTKIQPSDYLKLIDEGKEHLENKRFDKAISLFKEAKNKDQKPSLACFYEGLSYFKTEVLDNSQDSYQKGLIFNKIHYKCLVGLFDLLMSLQKYDSAYEIVQRIVRFFPANPKRLSSVLRLAIQTKHYSDIDAFYQEFLKIDERNDELIKSVCAALIVCGKYFFEINDVNTANDLIKKSCVSAAGRHPILRKAIEVLVEFKQLDAAKFVLKKFARPTETDTDYAISLFLVSSLESQTEFVINKGLELLQRGIQDQEVYRITIQKMIQHGLTQRSENLLDEALKLYPDLAHDRKKAA